MDRDKSTWDLPHVLYDKEGKEYHVTQIIEAERARTAINIRNKLAEMNIKDAIRVADEMCGYHHVDYVLKRIVGLRDKNVRI